MARRIGATVVPERSECRRCRSDRGDVIGFGAMRHFGDVVVALRSRWDDDATVGEWTGQDLCGERWNVFKRTVEETSRKSRKGLGARYYGSAERYAFVSDVPENPAGDLP
jgi:hypothetical protein